MYIDWEVVSTTKDYMTSLRFHLAFPLSNNIYKYTCLWCNGYLHQKWTRRHAVQILDETDIISHSTNTLGKGKNPLVLPPAMGK